LRYTLIACEIFYRELCLAVAKTSATVDIEFLPKGMHNTPAVMRQALQEKIDAVQVGKADAILLAFGLCGNVAKGICAGRLPVVIPRVHDCISLFLGSRDRYNEEFAAHPGTYYYSSASFERADASDGAGALGASGISKEEQFAKYAALYGEENARYLLEVESSWAEHYTRAAYLRVPELDFLGCATKTTEKAKSLGLAYQSIDADLAMLDQLLSGKWSERDFLFVPPGHCIQPSNDEHVLQAVPTEG
jgi:hypothetical protein